MAETIKEIWAYRSMIQSLVHKDLRGRYKASVLGFLWTFIYPLCQLLVYTVVFSVIMRSDLDKFYLYLFVALIPWNFFASCLTGGSSCVIAQQSMVNKIYFPREVIPIAYVTSSFVNMLYCELVVIVVSLLSGVHVTIAGLLCLIPVMLVEYMLALGVTLTVSAIDVYFRDLEHILGILSMVWMFMTPIMYDLSIVPEGLQIVFRLNPMTAIVSGYRDILYWGGVPDMRNLGIAAVIGLCAMVIGFLIFGRLKRRFSEVM